MVSEIQMNIKHENISRAQYDVSTRLQEFQAEPEHQTPRLPEYGENWNTRVDFLSAICDSTDCDIFFGEGSHVSTISLYLL